MSPDADAPEMNKALFMELVMMLSTSVMHQLGKLVNPVTGKAEVNLEAAQATIDMMAMLEAKTRGNLDKDEDRLIKTTLATLQMNYVETARSAVAQPAPEAPPAGSTASAEETPQGTDTDPKGPRFHKTYE